MTFLDKCNILGELWVNYKDDQDFKDFIIYNDLGLPLAYMISEGLSEGPTPIGTQYIDETFELFLTSLSLSEDDLEEGMDLQEIFEIVEKRDREK